MASEGQLFEIVGALAAGRRLSNLLDGWDQERDQDANDGDHDQQLDEREGAALLLPASYARHGKSSEEKQAREDEFRL
jgi:hypothetical protein